MWRQIQWQRLGVVLLLVLLLPGCTRTPPPTPAPTSTPIPVTSEQINDLLCPADAEADCLEAACPDPQACPLAAALSDEAVFTFVREFSGCPGCNTPRFDISQGIDRCVEYRIDNDPDAWLVSFWVSGACQFRYGNPEQTRITVSLVKESLAVRGVDPPREFIQTENYCEVSADCRCLSGSGVEFVGCNNTLYAPLWSAGSYTCDRCICQQNTCVSR